MTEALEGGFDCTTCDGTVENVMELMEHDCDEILSGEVLSSSERSTLLYIESRLVDNRGTLDLEQMNYEDRNNIKLFAAAGLLDVKEDLTKPREPSMDVVRFTDEAWDLAAQCRKLRGKDNVHEVES